MIRIDGSRGEGGGQVLRSALGLALATGQAFEIDSIRAGRRKPGLMRQHLTCVRAATEVSNARVSGDELGSTALRFEPGSVRSGNYHFAVGTAGSTSLVLQTILPGLWSADGESSVCVEGGTHNPLAPTFDFLERCFFPQLTQLGSCVEAKLVRPGFFPAGGGEVRVNVTPASTLHQLELLERGPLLRRRAEARLSALSFDIATRELELARDRLGWLLEDCVVIDTEDPSGPGNVLSLELQFEHVTELVTSFGEKSRSAERVAKKAVNETQRYLACDAPVGRHLADQLLLPMALAGGGSFRTLAPTLHTQTNAEIIATFLPVDFRIEREGEARTYRIEIVPR